MRTKNLIVASVTMISLLAVAFETVCADTGPKPKLTFDSVLNYAFSGSPLVKQIDSELATRLAESTETKLLLNPQLGASVGLAANPAGDADKNQIGLVLSQPIRPSDFGARAIVAELLSKSADVEQRLSVLELSQSIYQSYSKLWILQEQKKFLLQQRERTKRISEKVNTATSRGALSKGEGGLFAAEFKKLSAQVLGIEADLAQERAAILRLANYSIGTQELESPEKSFKVAREQILSQLDEGSLPIQQRYELLAKVANEREKLARKDAFPAFSPQLSYQRTEDGGDFVGVGVQFELPFFNRNQAEIMRRHGEVGAAQAKNAYSRSDQFKEQVTLSLNSIQALRKQAETFEADVVPALVGALRNYEEQFSAGTGSVLSMWQAQREISNAQIQSLDLWLRFFNARSDLSIISGQQL